LQVAALRFVDCVFAPVVDHAFGIANEDVLALHAEFHHQIEAGDRRGAGARDGQLHIADGLAHQFQPVQQRRGGDDRGTVLVIMEHRDLQPLAQLAFDRKTLRRLDVFEVYAAQSGL
jgi:hypothetical protein